MPKPANSPPDKKQIDKAVKNIKTACDGLKACGKELGDVAGVAKELDKLTK